MEGNQKYIIPKIIWLVYTELLFFIMLLIWRLELIYRIKTMDEGLRRLISLSDYETGWGLYYCLLGIASCLLVIYQRTNWTAWNLKIMAYACVLISFGLNYIFLTILCIAALVFYQLRKTRALYLDKQYDIIPWRWLFVPGSILLIVTELFFPFLFY